MKRIKFVATVSAILFISIVVLTSSSHFIVSASDTPDSSKPELDNPPQLRKIINYEISNTAPTAVSSDISSDGKLIVFASNSGDALKKSSLLTIRHTGSLAENEPSNNATVQELPIGTFSGIFNPRISPDDTVVLFTGVQSIDGNGTAQGLFQYDLTKDVLSKVPLHSPSVRSADWASNGAIIYSEINTSRNGDNIWIAAKDGSNPRLIYNSSEFVGDIDVNSNGTRVAFVTSKPNDVYSSYLKILDIQNGKAVALGDSPTGSDVASAAYHQPRWVLDDKFLVATYFPKTSTASSIRLVSDDGMINTPLYNNSSFDAAGAAVTNGGKTLVFSLVPVSKDSQESSGIYELQFDHVIPEYPITTIAIMTALSLSPILLLSRIFRTRIQ